MKDSPFDLPPEIVARLLACVEDVDGEIIVRDSKALFALVDEHGSAYPVLQTLVKVDEEAIQRHIEETGEAPPGVKAVGVTVEEGSNVIGIQILHGAKFKKPSS